jgi:hypothetical protein
MNLNKKTLVTSLIAGAILLVPTISYADTTPAPTQSPVATTTMVHPDAATKAAHKAAMEAYRTAIAKWKMDNQAALAAHKTAMDAYHAAQMKNKEAYKMADANFKTAVEVAQATFKAAVSVAGVTVDAKNAAATARKAAMDTARSVRDAAKAAIVVPTIPQKPVLTVKPVEPTK